MAEKEPKMTWRCDSCGAEFDYFTYGGPCPGTEGQGCDGELHRKRKTPAPQAEGRQP